MTEGPGRLGLPPRTVPVIVAPEVASAVPYAFPQTVVLGAIVMTGFLGGVVACHVRVEERQFAVGLIVGALACLGLYLRDARVRALVPFQRLRPRRPAGSLRQPRTPTA